MMGISRCAITYDFAQNLSASAAGAIQSFQGYHGCALSQSQSITMRIEGTAFRGGKGLQ